jgi:uncharacterized membrane protein
LGFLLHEAIKKGICLAFYLSKTIIKPFEALKHKEKNYTQFVGFLHGKPLQVVIM